MKTPPVLRLVPSLFLASLVLLGNGVVSTAQAQISQQFRENLQRQYESGNIPDPKKNQPYEERLAIRKKQQKLAEQQQQNPPSPPPRAAQQERDDGDWRNRGDGNRAPRYRSDRSYGHLQDYCRSLARPGSADFSRCIRDNENMNWRERNSGWDEDRHERYERYDRYDRPYRNDRWF